VYLPLQEHEWVKPVLDHKLGPKIPGANNGKFVHILTGCLVPSYYKILFVWSPMSSCVKSLRSKSRDLSGLQP
jgi:hypothetical protein